ncbi:MAG: MBL fold metallo-hydrolase [Comamonadaceae bacterium]|nr:MAG: MBL fold metallo-hydrolase [Comamonadaceae bacterium]
MIASTLPTLPAGVQILERGWLSANNIVFTGGAQTAMIDSGYCTHASQTVALVESALNGRPLDMLANTHLHSDHCGGNAALQDRYASLQTLIPPGHAAEVARWDAVALTYEPTGQRCPRFRFDDVLRPGRTLQLGQQAWEVHAAKGHDPHSVIFFEPASSTLISADALWENGFGVVFPELEGEQAFAEVAATLDLIAELGPRVVIPGHGGVFHYSGEVLGRARTRLDSFVNNPVKHAQHAGKVLMKYKLLEVQRQPVADFMTWAMATPYFALIHGRFFVETPFSAWLHQLIQELIRAGAARQEETVLVNT